MNDKRLVCENDEFYFYTNYMTENIESWCSTQMVNNNPPLENYRVLIAEHKPTGFMSYVLFDDKGEPIYENTIAEQVCSRISILRVKRGWGRL